VGGGSEHSIKFSFYSRRRPFYFYGMIVGALVGSVKDSLYKKTKQRLEGKRLTRKKLPRGEKRNLHMQTEKGPTENGIGVPHPSHSVKFPRGGQGHERRR